MPTATSHRVLIVGVGSIGERHLRCFKATERAEVSLCEPNDTLRTDVAKRYNVSDAFSDYDQALKSAPDAVVIATPAPMHVAMATKAFNAGLHALIEKPLSTSLDGVNEMVAARKANDRVVAIGYTWRSQPLLLSMKAALDSGKFGKPLHLTCVTGQNFPAYRPAYRDIYYARHEAGGGAIQDALTHMLNAGEWLAGPIDRLACDASHQAIEGVEVEDTVNILARQGGAMASYSLNQFQGANETTITVVCEEGMVRLELHNARWRWRTEIDGPEGRGQWHDEAVPPGDRDANYISQANAFLDAVEGKAQPRCTLEEGVQTLKVNLAALKAWREQCWVEIDSIT